MQRAPLFIFLIVLAACASSHRSAAPVTVVVIAQEADRNDADRLRAFTEEAIQRYGGSPRVGVVTIDYFGPANRVALPRPEITRGANGELVYAAFTITDRAGNVLRSERLPYLPSIDQLKALHDTADIIAKRVAQIVDVVVTATQPYRESDVTLLREITDAAIRRRVHDAAVMKVAISIEYRRGALSNIPIRWEPAGIQVVGATYTITDAAGNVLESQSVPMTFDQTTSNLSVMHDAARWIAKRVAHISGS